MLSSLNIKNIVLIKQLSLTFKHGLSALTGETGAGKSILLDSLGLVLGARSDSGLVRHAEDTASVTASFDLDTEHDVFNVLKEHDIDADDTLIIRRVLNASGKSKAYINDQPVTAKLLQKVGALLVEIHGQFDTQSLFDKSKHKDYLDRMLSDNELLNSVSTLWSEWQDSERDYREHQKISENIKEEEEFLRTSVHDLDALDIKENEEQELTAIKNGLMKSDQILEVAQIADKNIAEMETLSADIWRGFDRLEGVGQGAKEVFSRVEAELLEFKSIVHSMAHDVEHNNYSLEEVDDRLHALKAQAKKHSCDIESLVRKREELAAQLNNIENFDDLLSKKLKKIEVCKNKFFKEAEKLSSKRKDKAVILETMISEELPSLKLENAKLSISISRLTEEKWGRNGLDDIEFLVSTNPGTPLAPLNKVASGGEMSRFILGMKAVLNNGENIQTMIFDEVDSGIGGATAAAVGKRLSDLSNNKQILVVTHSPQVAAIADNHFHIEKSGDKEVTTNVRNLSDGERQDEVARMLAGDEVTQEARAAASKLLEKKAA